MGTSVAAGAVSWQETGKLRRSVLSGSYRFGRVGVYFDAETSCRDLLIYWNTMSNIKVALRIRPLTLRESTSDDPLAVQVDANNVVHLHNSGTSKTSAAEYGYDDISKKSRQFAFDYCFPSTDGSCTSANIANQEKVFEVLGKPVLDSLFEGYNACVLAYGQSGTGKTYTMLGTPSEPGLAPRLCAAIFDRKTTEDNCHNSHESSFRIDVSFMEIYNEKVRDLLEEKSSTQNTVQLKVREHPKSGPYVQGLSRHAVNDAATALKLLNEGIQRRSSAATYKNGHSSRSHAVFTVQCTAACVVNDGLPRETVAKLHLVDLAGSERANHDLVSRLRLKEGSLINKSLASLGNVINALAEKSSVSMGSISSLNISSSSTSSSNTTSAQTTPLTSPRRSRTPFIPYRDSVLTWILKDSLGGNSKTFVVAAISPSARAFKETLNTLRFAQRAKHIVNQPVVNEEASVKLIRHLKEEVSRLRALFSQSVEFRHADFNSGSIRSENMDLMRVNHSKACALTEDWLQKWRYRETDESADVITHTRPPRSIEVGVQASFPIVMDDPADLIPVKEAKPAIRSQTEVATSLLGNSFTVTDSESNCWSDDSLDGSYPTEVQQKKFIANSSIPLPISQETTDQTIKPDFKIGDNFFPPWSGSHHQPGRPPSTPTSKKRISPRKVFKPRPDVRTIFNGEFQHEEMCSSLLSTPAIIFDPPSGGTCGKQTYLDSGCHSPRKCSMELPYNHYLQSSLDNKDSMIKFHPEIDNMINGSYHYESCTKPHFANNRNVPPKLTPERNLTPSVCKATCCCLIRHHCSHCIFQKPDFVVQASHQHNSHCQHNRRRSHHTHSTITLEPHSFEAIIRAELLAIRRRMVARTASPKVAISLPYLSEWKSNSFPKTFDFNSQDNLPGEVWV